MTPPPMMTTRARLGGASVIELDFLEEAGVADRGEAGGGAVEALHGPGPEVVLDRAGAVLDRAPQRPAVHTDQAEQPGPGGHAAPGAAVVRGDQPGQGVGGQAGLGRDVAQLEAGVVVAGQLVVDEPDPVAVVDEVGGQQVVVAGNGGRGPG